MSRNRRVVWSEGMLLSPQHLQQWDRHLHHRMGERFRATQAFEWGLTHLELDREALRNGRLIVLAARGVLPDGTPFAAPEDDPLPAPRAVGEHFGTRQEVLPVFIGLPSARPGRAQLGDLAAPGAPGPRFALETVELPDDNDGGSERQVALGAPNLCVLFADDALGDYDHVPIAEVVRTADGAFSLRDAFVPPALSIGASETLLRQLRGELEMLITKSLELSNKRRPRGEIADFASADSSDAFMLQSVNRYIPILAHYTAHRRIHPEQVYLTLVTLAGELCAFSLKLSPKDLPVYDHRALADTFVALHRALAALIELRSVDKFVRIDLERKDGSIYVGRIQDPRLLESTASLFLGARAELEEQQLIADLPAKVKIASLDRIDFLIANALRGVAVNYSRNPPPSLPARPNYLYFQLDPVGDAWESVRGAKNLAIFAPPDVPGLTLELVGLRD